MNSVNFCFQNVKVFHCFSNISNHCSILLDLLHRKHRVSKGFRFKTMWFRSEDFLSKVRSEWCLGDRGDTVNITIGSWPSG